MKPKLQIAFFVLALLLPVAASAQFVLSGELRPRAEYRHGFKQPATTDMDAALFISQRSRLNFGYANQKMKVGVSLQDIRVWGNVPQLNLSDNNFSLHEAWGEYFFTPSFSLKLGRMELIYDDSRILGNVDWAQQGRSHDIGLLKFEKNAWKVHAGLAYNQDAEKLNGRVYTVEGNYKTMQLFWINHHSSNFNLSALFLNNGKQDVKVGEEAEFTTRYSQTFGFTGTYNLNPLQLGASIYKQVGKELSDKDLDALMYAFHVKWSINENLSFTPGFEYLSGTSQKDAINPNYNTINSFNPFYGTNHKFNGHMDYYYVGNHLNTVGLQDIFLKLNFSKNKLSAGADFHFFSSAADVLEPGNPMQTMSNNLGQELDLYLGYKLAPGVMLNLGYSQYFATETTIALKGGSLDETSNWAWASITFKPEFFRHSAQ
ncbi:alginate export family protein [Lentimicrobium sp.]